MRKTHLARSLAVLLACILGTGCYSTYVIPKSELVHLDGYDVHNVRTISTVGVGSAAGAGSVSVVSDRPYRVLATDGTPIDFNSAEELDFALAPYGTVEPGGNFSAVHVTKEQFVGALMDGRTITKDLKDINHAELTARDPGKTRVATVVGLTVVTIGLVVAAGAVLASERNAALGY